MLLNKWLYRFSLCLLLLGIPAVKIRAEKEEVARKTTITSIKWQGENIPPEKWNDIVIAATDTISFSFFCDTNDKNDWMMFDLKLIREDGTEYKVSENTRIKTYRNLAEQKYTFITQAFSPAGGWRAYEQIIQFTVNSAEAQKRKAELSKIPPEKLTPTKALPPAVSDSSHISQNNLEMNVVYWIVGGIFVVIAASVLIVLVKRKQNQNQETKTIKNKQTFNQPVSTTESFGIIMQYNAMNDQLLQENSALKAEIAALRTQIDAMQTRTGELQKSNKVLIEQKERLTEHKKQLEELQIQKDDLFAMVVHDIKNPAGLIKGLVGLLRSYDLTAQEQQEIMEDLVTTSSKILSLASEVSRVMALESSRLNLDCGAFPISAIIEDVCRHNSVNAAQKNIRLATDIAPNLHHPEIDSQKIDEVIDNLVSNAIKFSPRDSSVLVKAYQTPGNMITVEVIDNGLGLSEEDVKKAFGRGARLSAKPTGNESSSGLGLWIVKRIVEAHNGKVWMKSLVGKGSTFAFQLPFKQPINDELQS